MKSEIVDIRQFEASQFAPLLEVESRVWDENLRWDFTAAARQISTCLKEKRLSGCALVSGSRIRGYCFCFNDGDKSLIGDLFVEGGMAEVDQAQRLLGRLVETLVGGAGPRRIETQLPLFAFEQVEPVFRAWCFEGYRRRFMALSLTNRPWRALPLGVSPSGVAPEGLLQLGDFVLEPWDRKHDSGAAELLGWVYRHHVDTAINDQYASVAGTSLLIDGIVHHRGCGEYLPRASFVAIQRSTQKLAGVLALTAVRPRTAHIPQVAVASQFQGTGLGTALMESAFQELTRQGYREVSLTVTDLNAGAVRLYERLGFETFRPFGAFVWNRLQ